MRENAIPSPEGLSPAMFQKYFGTERKCHEALIALRWPNGFVCPHCHDTRHSYCAPKRVFQCTSCRKQTSVRAGTIFHKSRTPLRKWFLAIYLIGASDNKIKNVELAGFLGIDSGTAGCMRKKYLSARRINGHAIWDGGDHMTVFPGAIADTSTFLADKIAEALRSSI